MQISVQMYTVRSLLQMGMLPLCEEVKKAGFERVELAGFGNLEPFALKTGLNDIGLRISGSHVGEDALTTPRKVIDDHLALGCTDVAVAWLPESYRHDRESFERTAGLLQEAAHNFADEGIRLSYHNHDFEFIEVGGEWGWDVLMSQASAICAQVDVYWTSNAGHNPTEVLDRVKGRVFSIHAKDMALDGSFTEVGSGVLDWNAILSKCQEIGVETVVVENDEPKLPPLESISKSLSFLRAAAV